MASAVQGIWAVDIGSNSLKAIRLHATEAGLEVIGFDYIEHSRILSAGAIREEQKQEIISKTLGEFVQRNNIV